MRKIIVMISTVAVFALATFSANACPFDEHSASLKQDQVASALPDSANVRPAKRCLLLILNISPCLKLLLMRLKNQLW